MNAQTLPRIRKASQESRAAAVTLEYDTLSEGRIAGPGYYSVLWGDRHYEFGRSQAVAVAVLWRAAKRGGFAVHEVAIGSAIGSDQGAMFRLALTFRSSGRRGRRQHPAWGRMIVRGAAPRTYRLAAPERNKRESQKKNRSGTDLAQRTGA